MPKGISANDMIELAQRVRAAGFDCELNGQGHWQVTGLGDAGGTRLYGTFAATPSSGTSLRNTYADLKRSTGVDFRVQRRTPPKEDRPVADAPDPRTLALLADRNRNDAALETAALNAETRAAAELLRSAAESEERDLRTKRERDAAAMARAVQAALSQPPSRDHRPYPVEQPPRKITFTVAQMKALLADTVCNTRPVQSTVVEKYRDRMRRGEWRVTHQGVAIDWHGCLVDGRQRFTAAVAENMDMTIYATYGVDPATFFAMDTGKPRSAADAVTIAGLQWVVNGKPVKPNRTSIAAAVALCMGLDQPSPTRYTATHTAYSHDQLMDALGVMNEDGGRDPGPYWDLGLYTGMASQLKREAKLTMTAGYVGLFMAHRAFPEGPHGQWHAQLTTGANLGESSPALALRRVLANASDAAKRANAHGGLTTLAQYALYVKAWNMFLSGKTIKNMVWREDEDIPVPFAPRRTR